MQPEITEKLLKDVKCIAIVGAKDVPGQPVDTVGRYLIEAGYTVFPVHPVRKDGPTHEIINSKALREIYDMDIPIHEQNGCRICVYFNSHTHAN